MNFFDLQDLVVVMLGLDEDTADIDTIEQAVDDKFDISLEQFQKVVEALMPYTIPGNVYTITAESTINIGELYNGFVKDGMFICKQLVTPKHETPNRS